MTRRDMIVTPLVELVLLIICAVVSSYLSERFTLSFFSAAIIFFAFLLMLSVAAIRALALLLPVRPGVYSFERDSKRVYRWTLPSALYWINVNPFVDFVAPPFRKFFFAILGTRFGKGIVSIGGKIADPHHLVSISEGAIIGDGALLCAHAIVSGSSDMLVLGRITIGRNALVGARAMIMPNVTIGEKSMVSAMSLVAMNTTIPPYEVWAGVPAKKIGDIPR